MFGKIIISESEYIKMKEIYDTYKEYSEEKESEIKCLKSDLDSLRQQNSDLRKEINKLRDFNNRLKSQNKSLSEFRRDTLEAMGQVDLAGFRLSYCTKKCEHCTSKHTDCRKYKFGSHEYCVIPK